MLAVPSKTIAPTVEQAVHILHSSGQYTWECKWDGVRVLAYVDHGEVMLRNRNGVDTSHRYPEIVARLAELYPNSSRIFDGEMLVFGADGQPQFPLIHRRDAQSKPAAINRLAQTMPATFMAFDLLWFDGDDLRQRPLAARQSILSTEAGTFAKDPRMMLSVFSPDGSALWNFVTAHHMEGLIAKDRLSTYHGRRDSAWIKLKLVHRVSALVTGWEEGEGARKGKVGALFLSLLNEHGSLVPVGKVGTGIKEKDHAPMLAILAAGDPFIVEIEYQEVTQDGQLRFPSLKVIGRTDITAADCTIDQLSTKR